MLYLGLLSLLAAGGSGYLWRRRLGRRPAARRILIGSVIGTGLLLRPAFTAWEIRALQRDVPEHAVFMTSDSVFFNPQYTWAIINPNPGCDEYSLSFVKKHGTWMVEQGRSLTHACGLQ